MTEDRSDLVERLKTQAAWTDSTLRPLWEEAISAITTLTAANAELTCKLNVDKEDVDAIERCEKYLHESCQGSVCGLRKAARAVLSETKP